MSTGSRDQEYNYRKRELFRSGGLAGFIAKEIKVVS